MDRSVEKSMTKKQTQKNRQIVSCLYLYHSVSNVLQMGLLVVGFVVINFCFLSFYSSFNM